MSDENAITPNVATGLLVGTAAVGFPLIRGAFDAADSVVDAVRRSRLNASAPLASEKAAEFSRLVRLSVDAARARMDRQELAETLKVGVEQLEVRAHWLTAENLRQVLEDNNHVDSERVQFEIATWVAEPLRNAIESVIKRDGAKYASILREVRLELVKQAYLLLEADISGPGESNYGLQQAGKGFFRSLLLGMLTIPLAGLVIWAMITIMQIFD